MCQNCEKSIDGIEINLMEITTYEAKPNPATPLTTVTAKKN